MKPENQKIFEDNRHFHTSLAGPAQMLRGLNSHEKDNLLKAAREEFFGPGYSPDLYCPPCIADFIMGIYRRYDEWLSKQPVIVHANFPKHEQ